MEDLLKEETSVKSFTIKNNNDSSVSIYHNIDNNTTYQQSKDTQNLNEKIIKLFIGNHPLISMKTIKKICRFNFVNKYLKNEFYYNSIIIDHIIHNDSGHIVAEFKDFLIMGDINEFLQNYYKLKETKYLLPKIYEYYVSCSVIFPNYVILPESQYIYKNIQRKQRVIDVQQEQEDKEENIKKGLIKKEKGQESLFNTQVLDSILNQTDTSGIKQYFGVSTDGNSIVGQLSKIIEGINYYENNNISNINPKSNNYLYKNYNNICFNDSFSKNIEQDKKNNGLVKNENKMKDNNNTNKIKNNNNKNKLFQNKKINHCLNKNNYIQLSSSIKIINETSLLNKKNGKINYNSNSFKNIISRNKHYNKSKNKESNKKNGRNCLGNFPYDNKNYYTTTNSNGGFSNLFNNNTLNSKCNTSRNQLDIKKLKNIIKDNSKDDKKELKKNLHNSNNNICDPKSLNLIKKSLINSLLNSNKDIELEDKKKINNGKEVLNNFKECHKNSENISLFDSLTKNSLNNSKNKYKKEFSAKNISDKNAFENLDYKNKNNHHLFSGFIKNDKILIYRRKKNNCVSSFCNKKELSSNFSAKNTKIGCKTKNFSSNNIFGNVNNNLSNSNISYSIKNKCKHKENQKINNKKSNNCECLKEINGNNYKKKNKYYKNNLNNKVDEIKINKNGIETQIDNNFSVNGNNYDNSKMNKIEKIFDNNIINIPNKEDKINENNNVLNGINSYCDKRKNSICLSGLNSYKSSDKIINLDIKMNKKISEKNLKNSCCLKSPKNSLKNKKFLMKSDLREKIKNIESERPLTVRESMKKNYINCEVIEILTDKINKIKEYMKESDKKNTNAISQIFQKKKIEKKNIISNHIGKNKEDNIDNKNILSERKRNNLVKNKITKNNNIITENNKVKNIYLNNNFIKKNKKINKSKKNKKININNEELLNNKKNNNKNIKHYRYNSNYNINNGINYFFETTYNTNFKSNKNKYLKNNKNLNSKKSDNNLFNNNSEKEIISKKGTNPILLNNEIKSSSLKVLPIKQINQNLIIVKGIKINGFEKLISKKYTTRNIDVPQYATDRFKKRDVFSAINNSNKYINTSNSNKRKFIKKNIEKNINI